MFVFLLRYLAAPIAVGAVLVVHDVRPAIAQTEPLQTMPAQLLITPLLLDPPEFEVPRPMGLRLRVYDLPDGRRGERYDVEGWLPVGEHSAFAWEIVYAGVESDDLMRYGGGPPRLQWTTRVREVDPLRVAFDVATVLPLGDASLHPISTKAATLLGRVRLSPVGGARWRVWAGYWGQRVSPPRDRDRPLSYFPSGSGVDVACVGAVGRVHWEMWWHRQLGGLLDTSWLEANFDFFLAEDIALRLGAATNTGAEETRQFDLGWTAGLTWHPRPVDEAR